MQIYVKSRKRIHTITGCVSIMNNSNMKLKNDELEHDIR
jgi:hypothetical protein